MTSPWWSKQTEGAPPAQDPEPAAAAPLQPQSRSQATDDIHSIGEQIDSALGEFENRLAQLRDVLDDKKHEITEIEAQIEAVEKDQAKAFKSLLSDNPAIKKILQTGGRRRMSRRHKNRRKTDRNEVDPHR